MTPSQRADAATPQSNAVKDAATPEHHEPDEHIGAVEGDRPGDPQQGNENASTPLDDEGLPSDRVAVCEDAIGANVDESQG